MGELRVFAQHTSGSESFTGWGALFADMRATQVLVLADEVLKRKEMAVVNDALKILVESLSHGGGRLNRNHETEQP
jgi:hypothetical protein